MRRLHAVLSVHQIPTSLGFTMVSVEQNKPTFSLVRVYVATSGKWLQFSAGADEKVCHIAVIVCLNFEKGF